LPEIPSEIFRDIPLQVAKSQHRQSQKPAIGVFTGIGPCYP